VETKVCSLRIARRAALAGVAVCLAACTTFGPHRLAEEQVDYSRALSDSQKSQTLLNIVRIRYGDPPVFLNATQVISAYQLNRGVNSGFQVAPGAALSDLLTGSASLGLQQTPTFTFEPVIGDQLAQSIMRPLSPTELLPLSLTGLPVDVLFRLAVQSVNGLQNSELLGSVSQSGSPDFFRLLYNLRRLQMAQLLGVRLDATPEEKDNGKGKLAGRLILSIEDKPGVQLHALVIQTRQLLGMPADAKEAVVVYGRTARNRGQVAIVTRPILGVLQQVASEVRVPAEDVESGLTVKTMADSEVFDRPAVIIRSSHRRQSDAYAQVRYRGAWYWIASNDFDSKLTFSVLQLLLTLAQTNVASGTLVTIPAH
jgi:hypothetical protein